MNWAYNSYLVSGRWELSRTTLIAEDTDTVADEAIDGARTEG